MKKFILILAALAVSLVILSAAAMDVIASLEFNGTTPYMEGMKKSEDLFTSRSPVLAVIYQANSVPYSLEWIDRFVSQEVKQTLTHLHEDKLQLLSRGRIISVSTSEEPMRSTGTIGYESEEGETGILRTIWVQDETGLLRLFSIAGEK